MICTEMYSHNQLKHTTWKWHLVLYLNCLVQRQHHTGVETATPSPSAVHCRSKEGRS